MEEEKCKCISCHVTAKKNECKLFFPKTVCPAKNKSDYYPPNTRGKGAECDACRTRKCFECRYRGTADWDDGKKTGFCLLSKMVGEYPGIPLCNDCKIFQKSS